MTPSIQTIAADPLAPDAIEAARLRDITNRLHRLQRVLKMPMRQPALSGMDGDESVSVTYGELWWLSYYADTLQSYVSADPTPCPQCHEAGEHKAGCELS